MHQRIQLLEIRRTRVVVKPGRPNEEKPIPVVEHHVHAANASSYCLIDTLKIRVDSTAPLLHWKHRQAGTRRVPQALLRGLRYCRAPASFSNSVQPYASVCLGHQISSHGRDTAASAGSWQSFTASEPLRAFQPPLREPHPAVRALVHGRAPAVAIVPIDKGHLIGQKPTSFKRHARYVGPGSI